MIMSLLQICILLRQKSGKMYQNNLQINVSPQASDKQMYHRKTLANKCLSTKISHLNVSRQNFANECIPRTVLQINVQNTKLLACSPIDKYRLRAINESNCPGGRPALLPLHRRVLSLPRPS